jgi:outer membrane protein insertion porin family
MFHNREVWGRAAVAAALLAVSLLGAGGTARAQEPAPAAPAGAVVDSVIVRGNQRVPETTIRASSALRPGDYVRGPEIQNAIRRLMATGHFESVEIRSRGEPPAPITVLIDVVERPLVAKIDFRGLETVSGKTVRDTVGLRENEPLNPALVARTQQMIRELLAKQGRQVVSIDTALTPVKEPAGAVRLTFNVREGSRLSIADVDFRGNDAVPDGELQGAIKTREEGFLWFRAGKLDRETFRADLRERLPEFYASRGFIDFAVLRDTLEIDPETGKARLVVEVSEGPQYRLGEFRVEGNSRFPSEQLERYFTVENRSVLGLPFGRGGERERGEVFDRAALDDATRRVKQLYSNEGYLYAQVEPVVRRVPAAPGQSPTVNVVWAISERQPFYVRRVVIEGNSFTHESVIRERILLLPGDVYSEERLIASYTGIGALGFFETPLPLPDIDPKPEDGVVDIIFRVKEKQTGNINFGTSIGGGYYGRGGGVSGFLGYSQPNLFGQGKEASIRAEYGPWRRNFEASYTDPSILGGRNSGSVSLFHTGDRWFTFENVRRTRTGAALQFGVPVPGFYRTRAFLGYSLSQTSLDGAGEEEECTPLSTEIQCLADAIASTVSGSVTRDTKSHPLFPVSGTRQSLSLEQTGGPLGGHGNYRKVTGQMEWWVPAGRLGGSQPGQRPVRFTLGLQARAGTIFGDVARFPFEQFFAGGTRLGQPIRGYKDASINARGYNEQCRSLELSCLGKSFLTLTAEYDARITDQLSVGVFMDAGSVWRTAGQFNPNRLFRGAGIGGTVVTPFGPIGLDVAYGFDRPQPGWEVHFKFGQGF